VGITEVTLVEAAWAITEAEAVEEVAASITTGAGRVRILNTEILVRYKTTWVNSHNMAITNQ